LTEKSCDNCKDSYYERDEHHLIPDREYLQHCSNRAYNSAAYTHEMMMEDRGGNHCRFWAPKTQTEEHG